MFGCTLLPLNLKCYSYSFTCFFLMCVYTGAGIWGTREKQWQAAIKRQPRTDWSSLPLPPAVIWTSQTPARPLLHPFQPRGTLLNQLHNILPRALWSYICVYAHTDSAVLQDDSSVMVLREHLYLLLPCAAETLRRSTKLLTESSLDKQIIKKLHSKNNSC